MGILAGKRLSRLFNGGWWPIVGIGAAVLSCVGVGIAALAGAFATAPAASAAQADPVSGAMIRAITAGTSLRISPVRAGAAAVESAAISPERAGRLALASLRRPGTKVLGISPAYATVPPSKSRSLVWLVSLDPAGGMYSVGKNILANFDVVIIDARSGKWLMASVGSAKSLPALRPIPSAPGSTAAPGPVSSPSPGGAAGPGPSLSPSIVWVNAQVDGHKELILYASTSRLGGRPLYYNVRDSATKITCTGTCAKTWLPLHPADLTGAVLPPAVSISYVAGPNGRQAVYKGHPLYIYVGDAHGLGPYGNGKGGIWFVMTPKVKAAA